MSGKTQTGPGLTTDGEATQGPSAQAADVICRFAAESAAAAFVGGLRAVILIGSMARGEATVVWENGSRKVLGDAELLLIFNEDVALPHPISISRAKQEAEQKIAEHGVSVKLDLAAVHPASLPRMQRSIYTHEVKVWARVVWGDREILSLIPDFQTSEIPREDAWRLLCNRIIEVLEAAAEVDVHDAGQLSPNLHYRTVKLYQDMATSYLVFAGCYESAYRSRAERLARMAADSQPAVDPPFPLADFSARVSACTRFKMAGLQSPASNETLCPASADFMRGAIADAQALWRWELVRLIGDHKHRSDADLMRTWMRTLPIRARIRGWAHVVRKCGWHRNFRLWPRWLRLAVKSSPRYCVYAASSQVFFRLAERSKPSHPPSVEDRDLGSFRSWLPVEHGALKHAASDWRQVVVDIYWNYEEFLKDTQS